MMNFRNKLTFVTSLVAAGCCAAGALVACTEDTVVTTDGGADSGLPDVTTDTTPPDGGTDSGKDSGPDVITVEAGTLDEFIAANATATCARYKDCCAPAAFDTAKCLTDFATAGWNQSLTDLSAAGVADGGAVIYDPVAGSECLTAVRNMTCKNTTAAEFKNAWLKCYQTAKGNVAVGNPCKSNVECAPTAYCDTAGTGNCTALKAANDVCVPNSGECSYRQTGASQCVDSDGDTITTCSAALANGQPCARDWDCASGACSIRDEDGGVVATCENTVDFLFGICDAYKP